MAIRNRYGRDANKHAANENGLPTNACPCGLWHDLRDSPKDALNYSVPGFPRRREPRRIKELDPRLRGDDE